VTVSRIPASSLLALAALTGAACVRVPTNRADAMRAEPREALGEDRLSLHWKFVTADRLTEVSPQEFAQSAVYADTVTRARRVVGSMR